MRVNYLIQDLLSQGYWSAERQRFGGIMFTSQYYTLEEAENIIACSILSKESNHVTIVKHYTKWKTN